MKVALFTIWHVYNYGAEMQTYATVRALTDLGHTVEVVDIRLSDAAPMNLKMKVASHISSFTVLNEKFTRFWSNYIPSTRRYRSIEDLMSHPPKADVYLVGSDQVWNPELTGSLAPAFFLEFGNNIRRVSYASSFGTSSLSKKFVRGFCRGLEKFNVVSCREQSGVELLKKHFNIDAVNVLDPTLLHENYFELTGDMKENDSLVFYPVSENVDEIERFSIHLSESLNLSYINANKRRKLWGSIRWNCLSVPHWLRTIGQSKFVVTTSYHGMAFSLLFHRQFVAIGIDKRRNVRMIDLLSKLGLMSRYFESLDSLNDEKPWTKSIDYDSVDKKLKVLRSDSYAFLKYAII